MTKAQVQDYYTTHVGQEWRRLARHPYSRLEFATTMHFLEQHLPQHGLVLDAGGGPGRYTIELAKRGYDVVLLDLTPANIAFAQRQIKRAKLGARVKGVVEGTILDLSRFADNTFDAVICTGGPLSHVVDRQDRERAIGELIRVARPGAPIFVSVMGRLGVLVLELLEGQDEIELPLFAHLRDTGEYWGGAGFTPCYFFLPEELRAAFSNKGVDIVELVGLEGLSSRQSRHFNQLSKHETRFKIWLETHYKTCTHPSVVGMSGHLLIVCRKQ
jgi:SAM-dependent methyltransferase